MHSKRCSKTCICSVILGGLESFRNYKGLSENKNKNMKISEYYDLLDFDPSNLSEAKIKQGAFDWEIRI